MFDDTEDNLDYTDQNIKIQKERLEWDDLENYYKIIGGEILNQKYKVICQLGKGMFSSVVKVQDINTEEELGVKIMRSDEILIRAGEREKEFLKQLNMTDKQDKKNIIRMVDSFEHKKHLCLVFELMQRDLRETLQMFGQKIGISLDAVRSYAMQILIALAHMQKNQIIHSDLKPDNILIKDNKIVKICDFGTAFHQNDKESISDYMQSRFYRAPEVILGCNVDCAIDMWSLGCTLFELYTGNFLFPGKNNNEMIKLFTLTKGKFNNKMIRTAKYYHKYFDNNDNFLSQQLDPVTKMTYIKPIALSDKPSRSIEQQIKFYVQKVSIKEFKQQQLFKDILEKCLALDPSKRIQPLQALQHPFINIKQFQKDKQ